MNWRRLPDNMRAHCLDILAMVLGFAIAPFVLLIVVHADRLADIMTPLAAGICAGMAYQDFRHGNYYLAAASAGLFVANLSFVIAKYV